MLQLQSTRRGRTSKKVKGERVCEEEQNVTNAVLQYAVCKDRGVGNAQRAEA